MTIHTKVMGHRIRQFALMTSLAIDLLMCAFEEETGKVMVKGLRRLHQAERLFGVALCTILPELVFMNVFMTGRAFFRIFAGKFLESGTQMVVPGVVAPFTIQYLVFAFEGKAGDVVIKPGRKF